MSTSLNPVERAVEEAVRQTIRAFDGKIRALEAAATTLRTENETLRAERDAAREDTSVAIGQLQDEIQLRAKTLQRALTAEAERDAAIARAEEGAKEIAPVLGQLRHLYPIVRRINEELADGLLAPQIRRLEKLHRALTNPEPPHGD